MALYNVRNGPQIDDARRRKPKAKPKENYSDFLNKQRKTKQPSKSLTDELSDDSSDEEIVIKRKPKRKQRGVEENDDEEDEYDRDATDGAAASGGRGKSLESQLDDEMRELDADVQEQIKRDGQKLLRWAMNGKDDKHLAKRVLFNE